MKKSFGSYFAGWLAVLALFNVITFVTPHEIGGVSKFTTLFWIGYAFITLFFIGQLVCAYFVISSGSMQKNFYNIPLFSISIIALISMLVIGGLCMAIPAIPTWVGIILCFIVLVINVLSVVKATVAISAVNQVDKNIKTKTLFIKMLTVDAQVLTTKASDETILTLTKKVYEAVRYSDPMSDDALTSVEDRISDKFRDFSAAVEGNNAETAEACSKELLSLISERNAKCKILK